MPDSPAYGSILLDVLFHTANNCCDHDRFPLAASKAKRRISPFISASTYNCPIKGSGGPRKNVSGRRTPKSSASPPACHLSLPVRISYAASRLIIFGNYGIIEIQSLDGQT